MSREPRRQAWMLALLCAQMGVAHFVKPEPFDQLIPGWLPGTARQWTYGSGVAELVVAALLANPSTRRTGGWAAAALFVGVYPGNLKMAWDWRNEPAARQALSLGRLPLQFDLVSRALTVARD